MTVTQTNESPFVNIVRGDLSLDDALGVIEGYVAIWGDPDHVDSYGTWFDRAKPPEMGLDFAPWPLHYEHTRDGVIKKAIVGSVDEVWFDEIGIRFKGHLDRSSVFFYRIANEVVKKELATSSGTGGYAAEFDDDNRFVNWTLFEISLTKYASESRMPKVIMTRAADQSGRDAPESHRQNLQQDADASDISVERAIAGDLLIAGDGQYEETEMPNDVTPQDQETPPAIDLDALADLIAARMTPVVPQPEPIPTPASPVVDDSALRAEFDQLRADFVALQGAPPELTPEPRPAPRSPQISGVNDLRYAHLSHEDMLFGYEILQSMPKPSVSEDYIRAMAHKAVDAIDSGNDGLDTRVDRNAVRSRLPLGSGETRADELMGSTVAGQGDEWVGVFYSSMLWGKVRHANIMERLIAGGMLVMEVPQGHESVVVPTEGADPTWYKAQVSHDVDAVGRPTIDNIPSVAGTGNATLTPGTAKSKIILNENLVEDSIVPILPHTRQSLELSAADMVEYVYLNGDTVITVNTNINLIDGTPGTTTSQPVYLVSDGALKNALLTSGKNRSAAGSLTDTDFLSTIGLLATNLQNNRGQLLFVSDVQTEMKALQIPAVKTSDVGLATIINGEIPFIWRVPYHVSGQMALGRAADGLIPAAGGTTGRVLCVVPRYWTLGWKRRVTIETQKNIESGAWTVVASMRLGFQKFSTDASAASYNVGV